MQQNLKNDKNNFIYINDKKLNLKINIENIFKYETIKSFIFFYLKTKKIIVYDLIKNKVENFNLKKSEIITNYTMKWYCIIDHFFIFLEINKINLKIYKVDYGNLLIDLNFYLQLNNINSLRIYRVMDEQESFPFTIIIKINNDFFKIFSYFKNNLTELSKNDLIINIYFKDKFLYYNIKDDKEIRILSNFYIKNYIENYDDYIYLFKLDRKLFGFDENNLIEYFCIGKFILIYINSKLFIFDKFNFKILKKSKEIKFNEEEKYFYKKYK